MLYSLSTRVIADTVQAHVALELLAAPAEVRPLLSPLLDPSRRGLLTLMVKNAFAEIVLDLLPYVDDAELDAEDARTSPGAHPADDSADHLLQITLRTPVGGPKGLSGVIRRHLEMMVVLRVIHSALLTAASSAANPSALSAMTAAIAARLDRRKTDLVTHLSGQLASPFVRPRFP